MLSLFAPDADRLSRTLAATMRDAFAGATAAHARGDAAGMASCVRACKYTLNALTQLFQFPATAQAVQGDGR